MAEFLGRDEATARALLAAVGVRILRVDDAQHADVMAQVLTGAVAERGRIVADPPADEAAAAVAMGAWHVNAVNEFETVVDGEGIVEFVTIWPGWYRGRAIHIHSAIHVDDSTVLTTQYLFDDDLNAEVMASGPYAAYGQPDTTNAQDGVTRGAAERDGLLFTVADDTALDGRRALIVVGVAASD